MSLKAFVYILIILLNLSLFSPLLMREEGAKVCLADEQMIIEQLCCDQLGEKQRDEEEKNCEGECVCCLQYPATFNALLTLQDVISISFTKHNTAYFEEVVNTFDQKILKPPMILV